MNKRPQMNTQQMSHSEIALAQHPYIGFIACLISFITPFIGAVLPIVQLGVALVGLIIGVLTIEAKLKERKIRKNKFRKD